jgi:hypothetical protein
MFANRRGVTGLIHRTSATRRGNHYMTERDGDKQRAWQFITYIVYPAEKLPQFAMRPGIKKRRV